MIRDTNNTWDGVHRRSIATISAEAVDGHNYVRFEDVSGTSFTLNIDRNGGASRYGISGMQIVLNSPDPEPDPHPYLAWLADHGLGEGPDTASEASFLSDGVPNLLKYAANVSLMLPLTEAFRPSMERVADPAGDFLVFTYRIMANRTDVQSFVEQSSDLMDWSLAETPHLQPVAHDDGSITHRIRSSAIPANGGLFMRLRLQLNTELP